MFSNLKVKLGLFFLLIIILSISVVTLKKEAKATEDELVQFCRDNLAHFKCPSKVIFTELPKTSTGKIQKFVLRKQAKSL